MSRARGWIAAVALALATTNAAAVETLRDLRYHVDGDRALHLDLHRPPSATPRPLLVHVHGGGWSRGTRPPRDAFARWFAMGFAVAAVEYRLAGEAPAPAAVRDVRCALGWIGREAGRLGVDARWIVLEGGSAGGHLAVVAVAAADDPAFDAGCGPLPRIATIVDRFGIADLGSWHPPSGAVARWLGPRAGDVAWMRRLSPLARLHADMPPLFVVHGDADRVVPVEQSRRLHAAARALGIPAQLHEVAGGGHGGFDPGAEAAIDAALRTFLRAQGVPVTDGRPAPLPDRATGAHR